MYSIRRLAAKTGSIPLSTDLASVGIVVGSIAFIASKSKERPLLAESAKVVPLANEEQIKKWAGKQGQAWVRDAEWYQGRLGMYGAEAIRLARVVPGEAVLDLGCGIGRDTLILGRLVGPDGLAVGVDISGPQLAMAESERLAAGLQQVRYVEADAQTSQHLALGGAPCKGCFDLVYSRFGAMFFDDPTAAFQNIRRVVKSDGRLCLVVWQPPGSSQPELLNRAAEAVLCEKNVVPIPFVPCIDGQCMEPTEYKPGALGLSGRLLVQDILERAGFGDIVFQPFSALMDAGADMDTVVKFVLDPNCMPRNVAKVRDLDLNAGFEAKLRGLLQESQDSRGHVMLPGAVWIVLAQAK